MANASSLVADKLKVTLVISGAISLGSYESGVIYELARAARAKNGPFTIDFVAGTSAGSITGAQVAKVLVAPKPDFSSFEMWHQVTLTDLTTGYGAKETSPLSQTYIKDQLYQQLAGTRAVSPDGASTPVRAPEPQREETANETGEPYEAGDPQPEVRLLVTLTDLEGSVRRASYGAGIDVPVDGCFNGVTVTTRLTSKSTSDDWERVADLVLGSSAHSAAWEAVRIRVPEDNENGTERWDPDYVHTNLLARQRVRKEWPYFVDGGTVTNLPVGSALRMMSRAGEQWSASPQLPYDPYRIVLYVEPDPVTMQAKGASFGLWGNALGRAASIYAGSSIPLGDLRWTGETNKEIAQLLKTVRAMGGLLSALPADSGAAGDGGQPAGVIAPGAPGPGRPPLRVVEPGALDKAAMALQMTDRPWKTHLPDPSSPAPDPTLSDKCVDEFYRWLDQVGGLPDRTESDGAAFDVNAAFTRLWNYLWVAPFGLDPDEQLDPQGQGAAKNPKDLQASQVTREIRWEVLSLGYLYYGYRANRPELVRELIAVHKWAAKESPAGDRQWVYVTRIIPGDVKPYSRALGHFGGFLNPEWLKYDYQLGRQNAIAWLRAKFPESDYVRRQLQIDPPLPPVTTKELDPKLWAANIGPIAAVISQLEKTLIEQLPWLTNALVRRFSQLVGVWLVATVILALGPILSEFPGVDTTLKWMEGYLNSEKTGLIFDWSGKGTAFLVGVAAVWWWSKAQWKGRIVLLMAIWSVIYYVRRTWETLKTLIRRTPAGTGTAPPGGTGPSVS